MAEKKEKEKKAKKPLLKFGPFEQALAVLLVMGFASNPSLPFSFINQQNPATGQPGLSMSELTNIPLFTPPMIMLVIIAYIGYQILQRQETARTKAKAAKKSSASASKSSSSSSSSSSSKPMSSSDVRSQGLPSSSKSKVGAVGNPAPKHVSGGSGIDPRKDPSSNAFKKNYFLTMQGPGRPALVPFPDGLRPKAGEEEGTLWWDNVPDSAEALMAPPLDADKAKAMLKNPYAAQILSSDVELLKMKKARKEEEARYEKVGSLLQTILGGLLCAVDMRLGIAMFIFFLWRHFSMAHAKEQDDVEDEIEADKKELMKEISEAKKAGADKMMIQQLQMELAKL